MLYKVSRYVKYFTYVLLHLYIFYSFKTKLCFFFYQIASNLIKFSQMFPTEMKVLTDQKRGTPPPPNSVPPKHSFHSCVDQA